MSGFRPKVNFNMCPKVRLARCELVRVLELRIWKFYYVLRQRGRAVAPRIAAVHRRE
jgi:hypothetical protein